MNQAKPAVVLLSGGLDSTTVLAMCRSQGYRPYAMSFQYGQRHDLEIESAKRIAIAYEVEAHSVVDIDLRSFGGSALTADIAVPKHDSVDELDDGIPVTYVPARNTIFLAFALAWAEVVQSSDIFIGVNALDYSGYPDCRPEFVEAFQQMANLATKAGVEGTQRLTIHTPLIAMTKGEIIRAGLGLGVDYAMTSSCYDVTAEGACGRCDSCLLRLKGFAEAGTGDPVRYRTERASVSYLVKEIFYTLQGEGARSGRAAVFCRFTGCNLWTGREEHRKTAVCDFCDTDFVGTDGPGGGRFANRE